MEGFRPISWVMTYDDDTAATVSQLHEINDASQDFLLQWGGALAFSMQAGFCLLEAGSVRTLNVKNVLIRNVLDACLACLAYWSFGYGFSYGKADNVRQEWRGGWS